VETLRLCAYLEGLNSFCSGWRVVVNRVPDTIVASAASKFF